MKRGSSIHIALIVAADSKGVIGCNGSMPWHLPGDLRYFKRVTMGKPVIMGQKTWQSLKKQPLPGRLNIVLSRRADFAPAGAQTADSLTKAIDAAKARAAADGQSEIFIIGGGDVFHQALPLAQRIYWTEIQADIGGDTYFKDPLPPAQWTKTEAEKAQKLPQDSHEYRFWRYERRPAALLAGAKSAAKRAKPAQGAKPRPAQRPQAAKTGGGIFAFLRRFARRSLFLQSHR